jgi:hypothetical protein
LLIDNSSKAPRHHPFWDALSVAWTDELQPLSERFGERIKQHMEETDRAVKQAAKAIYEQLQQRPFLLKTLRGVRVTANIGGALMGFLIPEGGMVTDLLEDLVIVPAVMTGVEATVNGAVASYVRDHRRKLVEKLRRDAESIAAQLYRAPLLSIADIALKKTGTIGVGKDILERLPATIEQLQAQLAAKA